MARAAEQRPSSRDRSSRAPVKLQEELCHPRGRLKACLLLLLQRGPAHGYELFQRVKPLGYQDGDAAVVYRALHWLKERALIDCRWDTSGRGPARRVFDLTRAGRDITSACASGLKRQVHAIQGYTGTDTNGQPASPPPPAVDPPACFEVVVETKLLIQAADEAAAARAADVALGQGRLIGPGVWSTGEISVYTSPSSRPIP